MFFSQFKALTSHFSTVSASDFTCLQQLLFTIFSIKGKNKQQKVPEKKFQHYTVCISMAQV